MGTKINLKGRNEECNQVFMLENSNRIHGYLFSVGFLFKFVVGSTFLIAIFCVKLMCVR